MYERTCDTHTVNTRNGTNLHPAHFRLTAVQKGAVCSNIKIYCHLASNINNLINDKRKFKGTPLKTSF
jgi:hypothetical protein